MQHRRPLPGGKPDLCLDNFLDQLLPHVAKNEGQLRVTFQMLELVGVPVLSHRQSVRLRESSSSVSGPINPARLLSNILLNSESWIST